MGEWEEGVRHSNWISQAGICPNVAKRGQRPRAKSSLGSRPNLYAKCEADAFSICQAMKIYNMPHQTARRTPPLSDALLRNACCCIPCELLPQLHCIPQGVQAHIKIDRYAARLLLQLQKLPLPLPLLPFQLPPVAGSALSLVACSRLDARSHRSQLASWPQLWLHLQSGAVLPHADRKSNKCLAPLRLPASGAHIDAPCSWVPAIELLSNVQSIYFIDKPQLMLRRSFKQVVYFYVNAATELKHLQLPFETI